MNCLILCTCISCLRHLLRTHSKGLPDQASCKKEIYLTMSPWDLEACVCVSLFFWHIIDLHIESMYSLKLLLSQTVLPVRITRGPAWETCFSEICCKHGWQLFGGCICFHKLIFKPVYEKPYPLCSTNVSNNPQLLNVWGDAVWSVCQPRCIQA